MPILQENDRIDNGNETTFLDLMHYIGLVAADDVKYPQLKTPTGSKLHRSPPSTINEIVDNWSIQNKIEDNHLME